MMRPPASICSPRSSEGPLVRVTADAAYDTVAVYETGRCCMNTRYGWGGVARTSLDPPQEPHYGDEVEGSSQV